MLPELRFCHLCLVSNRNFDQTLSSDKHPTPKPRNVSRCCFCQRKYQFENRAEVIFTLMLKFGSMIYSIVSIRGGNLKLVLILFALSLRIRCTICNHLYRCPSSLKHHQSAPRFLRQYTMLQLPFFHHFLKIKAQSIWIRKFSRKQSGKCRQLTRQQGYKLLINENNLFFVHFQ